MSNPDDIQYPRALVSLSVSITGAEEPLDVVVIPRKVVVTRRSHTQAGTCEVQVDGIDLPFDPRCIVEAIMSVHLSDVRDAGAGDMPAEWRTDENRRFLGLLDNYDNEQEEDDVLTLRARDLSAILREAKPLQTDAVPRYSDTLGQAIARILSVTPGGDVLTVDLNGDADVPLSSAVNARGRNGAVHVENNWSAWEVIEHTAGLVARLVSVIDDRVLIRQGSQAYANNDEPAVTLAFNTDDGNLTSLGVEKKFQRNRKGVRVVCFDPIRRRTIEADWPDDATLRRLNPTRRRATGRSGRAGGSGHGRTAARAAPKPPDRDVLLVSNVTSEAALQAIARQVWEERSRQEMTVKADAPQFTDDFLALRNGDRVRIELNRALMARVSLNQPENNAVAFTMRRLHVSQQVAQLLIRLAAAQAAGASTSSFYVHEAQLMWADVDEGGDCGVKLELINLIPVEAGA